MRALTPQEIVRVWEAGLTMHALDRALALLRPVLPELDGSALAALPLGRRDAELLALREETFGREVTAGVDCPSCSDRLEFVTTTAALRTPAPPAASALHVLEHDGATIEFRLPDSRDLAVVARAGDADTAARLLLARCVVRGDASAAATREALAHRMLELDPQAEILVELSCPSCAHQWQASVDIGAFLWSEVAGEARRLLQQVHVLASAYGWGEDQVLALGSARRRFYLQLAGG